ncbi:MAG TPA: hypothetical protein VGQ10_07910 [Vicinamibacterales bacterium]|jgi:hypothetical protein|nr:hypothetical protein [Vicinamibacterales bacterium]
MRHTFIASFCAVAVAAAVIIANPVTVGGQSAVATSHTSSARDVPRMPDGQPDLQGTWLNFDSTPLEAPSPEDAARLKALAEWFPGIDAPKRQIQGPNPSPEFSDTNVKRTAPRRSIVVDPPSGRVPLLRQAEEKRAKNLARLTDSWEYFTPWERCITRGVPGGMFPAGYNNAYRIFQTRDYVAILYEMIHEPRIIPLDGRRHVNANIRLWNGDSRGRWEGNTLVVEVTNYRDEEVGATATGIATTATLKGVPQTKAMRVVERFTRVDANTLQYEATIEDPGVYSGPWKVMMPLTRADDYGLFEYACHEGNYGLPNSLSGSRAQGR